MYSINPMSALTMFHAAGSSLQVLVATGSVPLPAETQCKVCVLTRLYQRRVDGGSIRNKLQLVLDML